LKALPIVAFAASLAIAALLFARARSSLDLAVLAWMTVMLVAVRQTQAWHTLLLIPWIFAKASSDAVRVARIEFVAVVTTAVFL
jgi:hypothetical protein